MSTINVPSGLTAPSAAAGGSTRTPTSASDRARLTRDDFYKIMIGELSNQDPFDPMDNKQFLDQLASLQTLDATGRLTDGIEKLVLQNRMAAASGLIGREVRAVTAPTSSSGSSQPAGDVRGKVQRVLVQGGDVQLLLDGARTVKLEEVVEIS